MNIWSPDTCSGFAEITGATLRPGGLELTGHLFSLGAFVEGSRILDAGCGLGATTRYFSASRKLNFVSVDRSESMLAAVECRDTGVEFVCAELESLPFEGESFDGVLCECVLSQTDATLVVSEFHRLLRPGGCLMLTDLYCKEPASDSESGSSSTRMFAGRQQTEMMLRGAGFIVDRWEDRTNELRRLAAQLVMSGAKPEELLRWCGHIDWCSEANLDDWRHTVGYHLIVARKGTI